MWNNHKKLSKPALRLIKASLKKLQKSRFCSSFLILTTIIGILIIPLTFSSLVSSVSIKNQGRIVVPKIFDNCDTLGEWKVLSDKLEPNIGDNIIEVDTTDKVEGTASLKMTWAATGPNWGGMFYKDAKGEPWNLTQTPLIRMKFKADNPMPPNMMFGITTAPWNGYSYNIVDKLTAFGEWLTLDIDLRFPLEGEVPDLGEVIRIEFSCWEMTIDTPSTFRIDQIETLPGPTIPINAYISPALSRLILINETAVNLMIKVIGGEPPYTYEWFVNDIKQPQTQRTFTYFASRIATDYIYAKVTDSLGNSAKTTTITVTVINRTVLPEPRSLHTEGAYIYNDKGELVHLRGVHSVNFGDSSTGWLIGGSLTTWDEIVVEKNLKVLESWGCNFLYLSGIDFDRLVNNVKYSSSGTPNIGAMDAVKRIIELAYEHGIYIAIGIDNMVLEDTPNPEYIWNWAPAHLNEWVNGWLKISRELRRYPNALYGMNAEATENLDNYFNAIVQALKAIRNDGDEHIFFYHEEYCTYPAEFNRPATQGGEMIRKLHEQNITNIIYSGHMYRWHGTFGGNPDYFDPTAGAIEPGYVDYDGVYEKEDILDALTYWGYKKILEEYQVPIIMGEGGPAKALAIKSPNTWQKEMTCYQNLLKILNEWKIGYACFWWREPGTEGAIFSPLILPDQTDFVPNEWGQILILASRG